MRALFVCSTGGHLSELLHWTQRITPTPTERIWVTHDRANAADITRFDPAATVVHTPPIEPKQAGAAAAAIGPAVRLIRSLRAEMVVSSGAAIAVPFAIAARVTRVPFRYVESATRVTGPSLTGRIVNRLARGCCLAQVPVDPADRSSAWRGWLNAGSVFDRFAVHPAAAAGPPRRIVVALGTQSNFGFRAAVEAVCRAVERLDPRPEIVWQVGSTDTTGLPVDNPRAHIPEPELMAELRRADVVITHAGVGLASLGMQAGKAPILLPRRHERAEHTDDHQAELAQFLSARSLASACEAPELTTEHLLRAQRSAISAVPIAGLPRLVVRIGAETGPQAPRQPIRVGLDQLALAEEPPAL